MFAQRGCTTHAQHAHNVSSAHHLSGSRGPTPEELLRQAGGGGIQLKEVSGASLQSVAPARRAEMEAVETALGSDYAKDLQASAKKHEPNKRQKQRHQINSLYHAARMTELQDMERKAQGTKSKAETAAKYGW